MLDIVSFNNAGDSKRKSSFLAGMVMQVTPVTLMSKDPGLFLLITLVAFWSLIGVLSIRNYK
jgi:hypothetical protein